MNKEETIEKSFWKKTWVASFVIPAIILVIAGGMVFGIMRLLDSPSSYRELVREMKSKTFGNRWVAAYELSKLLGQNKIAPQDVPWVTDELVDLYETSEDPRTRHFVVVALGVLPSERTFSLLAKALGDADRQVVFSAVVAIGKLDKKPRFDWNRLIKMIQSDDSNLVQAIAYTLSKHNIREAQKDLESLVLSPNPNISFPIASALVSFKSPKSLKKMKEVLLMKLKNQYFSVENTKALQLNFVRAVKKSQWKVAKEALSLVVENIESEEVKLAALDASRT